MKLSIDNEEMIDDFFDHTKCVGIVSPLKGYQFVWAINRYLSMDFRACTEDDVVLKRSDRKYRFHLYTYDSHDGKSHFLYQNQYDGGSLMPDLKHLDYIWLLRMEEYQSDFIPDLIDSLRTMEGIHLVMELQEDKFKNPENLII